MRTKAILVASALAFVLAASGTTMGVSDLEGRVPAALADNIGPHVCIEASSLETLNIPAVCEHGPFQRTELFFSHGFGDVPYAANQWDGIMQSWLVWDGQDRGFQCEFDMGALVACMGLGGAFPTVGAEYSQECLAFERLTGLELPIALTEFGCANSGGVAL